jgi:hypothetical protein
MRALVQLAPQLAMWEKWMLPNKLLLDLLTVVPAQKYILGETVPLKNVAEDFASVQ